MSEVTFNKGKIPETRLPNEDPSFEQKMKDLRDNESDDKRSMLLTHASKNPESIAIWCVLGLSSTERMESYAYFRVAYHRGLDSLRKMDGGVQVSCAGTMKVIGISYSLLIN